MIGWLSLRSSARIGRGRPIAHDYWPLYTLGDHPTAVVVGSVRSAKNREFLVGGISKNEEYDSITLKTYMQYIRI